MGKSFQKVHACCAGSFGDDGEKIPQWLRANGGTYSREMNADITHLITTESAFKRNVEAVRAAKKMKHVKIVSYDWLEDSLMSKTRRPKREGPYLWEKILKKTKKKGAKGGKVQKPRKAGKGRAAKSMELFKRGARALVDEMEKSGYHLYTDRSTGATYCATLVRPTLLLGRNEKYQVKLYESNAEPRVYATYVKYSRVGKSGTELVAPRGSSFELAVKAFQKFFKIKTGKNWEERFDGKLPEAKKDLEGNRLPSDEGWFRHELPTGLLASLFMQTEMATAGASPPAKQESESQALGSRSASPEILSKDEDEEKKDNLDRMSLDNDDNDEDADKEDNDILEEEIESGTEEGDEPVHMSEDNVVVLD